MSPISFPFSSGVARYLGNRVTELLDPISSAPALSRQPLLQLPQLRCGCILFDTETENFTFQYHSHPSCLCFNSFFFTFLPHNFYCVFFFALRDVFSLVRFSVPRDLIFLAKGNQRRRNPSCVDSGSSGQGFFAYFL